MERVVGRVPVGDIGAHGEGWVCEGPLKAQEEARGSPAGAASSCQNIFHLEERVQRWAAFLNYNDLFESCMDFTRACLQRCAPELNVNP